MSECKGCGAPFDDTVNYRGEVRLGGPSRAFCSLTCKSKRANTPERQRAYRLKSMYGITPEEYDAILESQGGGCAICEVKASVSGRALHVDHDHESGKVRGILCTHCNPGIGYFKDNLQLLEKAMIYLTK